MIVVQLLRQSFRRTIPIEKAGRIPLPKKIVKYDGKAAGKGVIRVPGGVH